MKKVGKVVFGILLAIAVLGGGIAVYIVRDYTDAVTNSSEHPTAAVEFTIDEGETTQSIAERLEEEGLIPNKWYFIYYIRQSHLEGSIQAGTFTIPHGLSLEEVSDLLQHASIPDIWVTIPEGVMTTQIADTIEDAFSTHPEPSFDRQTFLEMTETGQYARDLGLPVPEGKPLEGFLYPDTYRFPADATEEYILISLLTNFKDRIYIPYKDSIDSSGYTLYEIVTFASYLERETKHPEDRPLVADILIRRLENNWPLAIDATILYYYNDWTHVITQEDLELQNPYNTRNSTGLTPTPIAHPGEETIRAVLYPESNNYWYYISDSEGTLHYATTLDEHNQNINTYLR